MGRPKGSKNKKQQERASNREALEILKTKPPPVAQTPRPAPVSDVDYWYTAPLPTLKQIIRDQRHVLQAASLEYDSTLRGAYPGSLSENQARAKKERALETYHLLMDIYNERLSEEGTHDHQRL